MHVCHVCAGPCLIKQEGTGSPGNGVTGGSEPLCGSWELNLCLLKEKSMILTSDPHL